MRFSVVTTYVNDDKDYVVLTAEELAGGIDMTDVMSIQITRL